MAPGCGLSLTRRGRSAGMGYFPSPVSPNTANASAGSQIGRDLNEITIRAEEIAELTPTAFRGTRQRTIRTEELLLPAEQEHRRSDHNSAPSKVVIERARSSFVVRAPANL